MPPAIQWYCYEDHTITPPLASPLALIRWYQLQTLWQSPQSGIVFIDGTPSFSSCLYLQLGPFPEILLTVLHGKRRRSTSFAASIRAITS